ncbi:Rrb1p [Sugiyamaella lignohabitans]|uniref:Rrb1p n=1 Tax=Sugiyamaella lignohabitans TaxID=796027 RepID=A0A167DH94_9ASCO|nr:Rrb1p [Sugiyamaella lignohabitans]ANB12916.1 Rrb1p [Sugiyamaella lignohabitans]
MSKRAAESLEEGRVTAQKTSAEDTAGDMAIDSTTADAEMGEFEDPYGDDFESEDEIFEAGDDDEEEDEEGDMEVEANTSANLESIQEDEETPAPSAKAKPAKQTPQIYLPHKSAPLGPDEIMEPDPTTYHMLHSFNVKWPCLSFDIIEDSLGDERRGYPQTTYLVTGTQAQKAKDNEISVMKLSSLCKTLVKDDDEEDDEDDDNDEDSDPILESKSLPTQYTTNRIRINPHAKKTGEYLTASMSESGDVYVWDISPHLRALDTPGTTITKQMNRPVHTIQVHGRVEGYALDWSPLLQTGALLTGDISGRIHLTSRTQSGWVSDRTPYISHGGSVEEIQWSRSEKSVFASGGTDGLVKIWDTRSKQHKPAISVKATNTDINVMSWNANVSYLLATGHDDGQWGVWDLRSFKPAAKGATASTPTPVASFDFHKSPITSIEFHPSEESIVAVGCEDNTVTLWDLSVEADDEEIKAQEKAAGGELDDIPSQLLFVHWQRNAKEVHWNKQIPGNLVSTGSDGFSLWKTISV